MQRNLKLLTRAGAAAAAFAIAHTAGAQAATSTDARWQPWIGCWQPAGAAAMTFGNEAPAASLVCVVPAGGSAVDVATVTDGRITARERVDASGAKVASTQDGCDGWRSGRWSPDGSRVYLRSEYSCPGSARRTSSGLLAISSEGELLDVERVGVDVHKAVRTLRYRPAAVPSTLATDLPTTTPDWRGGSGAARSAAAEPLTVDDVKELARSVDSSVLEAFLIERHQQFELNGRELVALADAGVPSRAIDAMVAVSYPTVFAVNTAPAAPAMPNERPNVYGTLDPVGYGGFGGYGGYGGYDSGFYGWNGYSPFGYAYGPYSGYGYGAAWYPPAGPVIVVRNPDGSVPAPHGRVVKGRGYTRDDSPPSGSSASPRDTRSSGSGSSAGSTRSAPPPPPPAGGTSTGRTAKPRP